MVKIYSGKKHKGTPVSYIAVLLSGLLLALGFVLANGDVRYKLISLASLGNTYYVSATGDNANNGSRGAPFKTFQFATGKLQAGDELQIFGGVYSEPLVIPNVGNVGAPITFRAVPGETPVIDLNNSNQNGVRVQGSYVNISDIEVKNVHNICVLINGSHVNMTRVKVHDCYDQGVQVAGTYVNFTDSVIYLTALSNKSKTISGGWPAGFKIREGEFVNVERNTIYQNYGEGMALRGKHVKVLHNRVYDNYSVNIYMGNSYDITVDGNFAYCSNNAEFFRDGRCANNMAMSEEFYAGWGSNLGALKIINNILAFGYRNINYSGHESGIESPGIKGAIIANNTLYGSVDRGIVLVDEPNTRDVYFYNNIVQQDKGRLADFKSNRGIVADYNFWVGSPTLLTNASGAHDLNGEVKFAEMPNRNNTASFRLAPSSPAKDSGVNMVDVTKDFEQKNRDSKPDRGALEEGAAQTLTQTPTTTPTPTATTTPRPSVSPTTNPTPGPNQITLNPSADSWVVANYPNENHGTTDSIRIFGTPVRIGYLLFDLSSLNGHRITSAELRLRVSDAAKANSKQSLKYVEDILWNERSITYNSRPGLGAAIYQFNGSKNGSWLNFSVTNYVAQRTGKFVSFGIDMTGSGDMGIFSRESKYPPQLIIKY